MVGRELSYNSYKIMRFNSDTLKIRKPLWVALSDLFLDNELQDHDRSFIAKQMKDSGFLLDEINHFLKQEVFPVCIPNLHSVAVEWTGFNEDWLVEKITQPKSPNVIRRWMYRRSFWMIKDD